MEAVMAEKIARRAERVRLRNTAHELDDALLRIKRAANKGMCSVIIYNDMTENNIEILKKSRYEVRPLWGSQVGEPYFEITW